MLAFYRERFDTVELNNTFYRLPPKGSCRRSGDADNTGEISYLPRRAAAISLT